MTTDAAIRTNYIFVDYENVQEVDLDLIAGKAVNVFLVVGQRRKTLPSLLARQIHRYHDQVEWIESEGASPNALDLVLAYHVGLQAKVDPNGYYHILARDKDYDPLIEHMRGSGIRASRNEEFARIPALVVKGRLSLAERVEWVVERFQKSKATLPKRRRSLLTTINALFQKELTDVEVEEIVTALVARKLIDVTPEGAVAYQL